MVTLKSAARLFLPVALVCLTSFVVALPSPPIQHDITPTTTTTTGTTLNVADRFFFSKSCETVKDDDTGKEEECCSGNFKCSSPVCKGKSPCGGFLKNFLWCRGRECKEKKSGTTPSPSPSKTEVPDDDEPEPSGGPEEEDEDKEKTPTPSPSVSATPNTTPTPTSSRTPTPTPTPSNSKTPTPSPSSSASTPPSALPSPPPSPPPSRFDPLNCGGNRRLRKDVRDLQPWERQRWLRATRAIMTAPPNGGLSEWEQMVQLHMSSGDEAHGGCYFMPWHRLFLLRIENLMRRHEPDVTLPYWDWTRDSNDAALSMVWNGEYLGGGKKESQPIPDGPFAGLISRVPEWHTVKRNFNSGASGSMQPLWTWADLDRVIQQPSWANFADGVESAHILPHIAIGGDMTSTHHAPNDPAFYLHHAYVDFLFAIRQSRFGQYDFGGTHDFATGTINCDRNMVFGAFGVPASRAFDVWCVDYAAPRDTGVNTWAQGRTAHSVKPRCNNEQFLNNAGMTLERCRRGASFFQE